MPVFAPEADGDFTKFRFEGRHQTHYEIRDGARRDLWRRRFSADPGLIGKTIEINNQALTVIGVAPPEYTGMIRMLAAELWVPVMMIPRLEPADGMSRLNNRGADWLFIVGRLKPEATLEQARARIDLISGQLREAYPEFWRKRAESGATLEKSVTILPESETRIPPGEGAGAYAFIAVILTIINLVMLIACLNLVNLLLARATARGKEMAVRLALGAARWRIVRQLTESVALSALAAPAGVLLAMWLMKALAASLPAFQGIRFVIDLQLDWRVLLYTLAFSFLVGLMFGRAPALQASRSDVIEKLKDGANTFAGARHQSRLRSGLIIAQVALSVVLLAGAGLVIRTLRNLNPINQGYDSLNLVVAPIGLDERPYDPAQPGFLPAIGRAHTRLAGRALGSVRRSPAGGEVAGPGAQPCQNRRLSAVSRRRHGA
jgi:predicted permease